MWPTHLLWFDKNFVGEALHFTHYNSCRIHQSLQITPAMAAGLPDHVWSLDELVALLDSEELS